MFAHRKSIVLKNAGNKITLTSNGSDFTDSSDNNIKNRNKNSWDLIKDLKGVRFNKTKESMKSDEVLNTADSSDIDMQTEVNSIMTAGMTIQSDRSVHTQVVSEYGRDIIRNMKISEIKMTGNLDRHEIKGSHRKQMVVWIDEVLTILKCPIETFFLAVNIMDRYLENSKERLGLSDLHEIGITSMFIASKYQEIDPLTLDLVIDKIGHGKFNETKLLKREKKILMTLKFQLSKPTISSFIENYCELFEGRFGSVEAKTSIKILALRIAKNGVTDRRLSFTVLPSELALCCLIISIKSYSKSIDRVILDESFSREIKSELTSDEAKVLEYGKRLRKFEKESLL